MEDKTPPSTDDVKRKVLLDLFVSPLTLLPFVGGVTALLLSWAVGGDVPLLTFGGVAGVLAGVGMFTSRIIFGLEKMTHQAYEYVLQNQQAAQQAALQQLYEKLEQDHDPRTERLLHLLQSLYQELKRDVEQGKITVAAHDVLDGVNDVFQVCLDYLDRSFRLWRTASRLKGEARERVLRQREELIVEVAKSGEHLEHAINQLLESATQRNKSELAQLRAELDETIRVARRAEARTIALGTDATVYDPREFE